MFSPGVALLKPSGEQPEQHQVMGEDPQDELARLGGGAAGGEGSEGGAEAALELAETALRVPALLGQNPIILVHSLRR
jgi:hypothetical protein